MPDTAIRAENLSKRYRIGQLQERHDMLRDALASQLKRLRGRRSGDFIWALKDISFEIKQGEVVGLIGRNGAGKSTLLKVLSRITEPTAGRAVIHGRVGSLLEVGAGFHPELTGRDNIYLNGAILGMRRQEITRRFDEIVSFAEVGRFLDTPVKRYSSGMYVRLAFAVAAHLEPEILLIDEVLAVGDASFQDKCLGKMGDVARSGRTVLFVSHNLGAVKRLCRNSLWIDKGHLMSFGRSDAVIGSYLNSASSKEAIWWSEDDGDVRLRAGPIRIREVSIRNDSGVASERFQMDAAFTVEIRYDLLSDLENLRFGITLTTEDGTVVFESKDTDPVGNGVWRPKGSYTARCHMPRGLLNAGRYYVSLLVDRPLQEALFRRDQVLCFGIEAMDERTFRPGEAPTGIVRPVLTWDQEPAESPAL